MEIDDLLKQHASDIEEDGAHLDVMSCPVFPPVGSVQALEVSHRVILDEVVKKLPVIDLKFEKYYRYMFFLAMSMLPCLIWRFR